MILWINDLNKYNLVTGIVTEADFIFIPEWPVDKDAWKDNLCKKLETEREVGNRY